MLVDTDVLVWYMRGNEKAKRVIKNLNSFSISVVTYIELVQGLRNKACFWWNNIILVIQSSWQML
jgi:predicted nucleic acid-binding protein